MTTHHAEELHRLQRWMHTVITHPDGIAAGLDSAAARSEIDITSADVERVVSRSQALDSVERLNVYGNAYFARLIECLASEFPATQQIVGEEAFSGFAFGFLKQFPSTSYTLADLGASFPRYLAETRPPREDDAPDWADFLVDVAKLERVYSEVFDGPGEEQREKLTAVQLQAIPAETWGDLRLATADSLRLIELRFPVQEYIAAARKGETGVFSPPEPTHLAINRREYIVRRRSLEPLPFDLLRRLQQHHSLGEAIADAVAVAGTDTSDLVAQLQQWFRDWTAAGYFVGIERAETAVVT